MHSVFRMEESLDKGNIVAVVLINLRGVPLAEAVSGYTLIAQIVTGNRKLLLYGPLCEREHGFAAADALAQTVVFHVLLNNQRDREHPALAGLLLRDFQPVAIPVPDNIA